MQLKTILNRVQKFKSFVYKSVRWVGSPAEPDLEVEVVERSNGKPICSGCGRQCRGYDRFGRAYSAQWKWRLTGVGLTRISAE